MTMILIDKAIEMVKRQQFSSALLLLHEAIDKDASLWNAWYLAGQCYRFLNEIESSIKYLSRATELKGDESSIFLALGIAFQLNLQWDEAIKSFRRAIEIDSDFVLAYNSLALTQKKSGELDKALHNNEAGLYALARQNIKAMCNDRKNPIFKYRETIGKLWSEYASYAMIYSVSSEENIRGVTWLTGIQAFEEERTEQHSGLYWIDTPNDKGDLVRLFLPNFFARFQKFLKKDSTYSNLIGNRGSILEMLGRHEEAAHHFDEASEFLPQ